MTSFDPLCSRSISGPSQLAEGLHELVTAVHRAGCPRRDELFTEFLPRGYRLTTLSSVPEAWRDAVILTKVRLGTLITLYDDLADNPRLADPRLLEILYALPDAPPSFEEGNSHPLLRTVRQLWHDVGDSLTMLPTYPLLAKLFRFDVQQFFQANRYSELLREQPYLNNRVENRAYVSHNMGILIVGTVDLMASDGFELEELGEIRTLFYRAQQASRLMNVLTTYARERAECDRTSELWVAAPTDDESAERRLHGEIVSILESLSPLAKRIRSFDGTQYLQGMQRLYDLHRGMEGII